MILPTQQYLSCEAFIVAVFSIVTIFFRLIVPSRHAATVRSKEQIMNKTFLAMMEALGFDVELH